MSLYALWKRYNKTKLVVMDSFDYNKIYESFMLCDDRLRYINYYTPMDPYRFILESSSSIHKKIRVLLWQLKK